MKTIPTKFVCNQLHSFRQEYFQMNFPLGPTLYVKLSMAVVAILVGGQGCQTQFWKRHIQDHTNKVKSKYADKFERRSSRQK